MRECLTSSLQTKERLCASDGLIISYPPPQVSCHKPRKGLIRPTGGAPLVGALLMSILLPISSFSAAPAAAAPKPPPDPEWEAAAKLFKQRHWADAEKAFLKYARRTPSPRRAEALVMAGRARISLKDSPAAQRLFGTVIREPGLRRSEPEAVAAAFDHLHRLMLAEGKPPAQRQRLLYDFKRALPSSSLLPKANEREADALLVSGSPQDALKLYNAAGAGLSLTGTNIVILLEGSIATAPAPLTNSDLKRQLAASRARPAIADGLMDTLARRKDGWRAEDLRAQLLLEDGKPADAATAWETMLKNRRGPADQIALARAAALGSVKAADGAAAYGEWLAAYPQSPLREQAEARHALLLAASGDLDRAIPLLQAFQRLRPASRYTPEVAQALARAQGTAKQIAKVDADRAVKEKQRRDDPALASLERGEKLLAKERFAQAAKELMAFRNLRQHPLWGRAWYGLGRAYDGLGQSEKALAAWDDVWRRGAAGTNILMAAESRRAAGDVYLNDLADPARALAAYNDTLRVSPTLDDGAFDLNRGLALLMLGRSADASAVFTARRDRAGEDKIEFLRWDNLVRQCAAGRLAPPPAGILPTQRRAQADLAMADVFLAGGRFERALRHYRHAARPLAGQAGEDRCALGIARSLASLGRAQEALRIFGHFKDKFGRSPLAPEALLRAGVLSASPKVNNFRQARQWFALAAANHPGTDAARAAEFYDATLAWRSRRWAEAEKLHKAFAANHPDSPLALVALDGRLPAIAKKSLEEEVDSINTVPVAPRSRKRSAFPIVKETAYSAYLDITSGLPMKESHIEDIDPRGGSALWTGPRVISKHLHRYHLTQAYSSEEYVMVRGTFEEPVGAGDIGPGIDPFSVTVPSVDVDWIGFERPTDEVKEETRHIIVPLNTNSVDDIRRILLRDPYDDDERKGDRNKKRPRFRFPSRVDPDITLDWDAKDAFFLVDTDDVAYTNTIAINGRAIADSAWPLKYRLELIDEPAPSPRLSSTITAEGQDTPDGSAIDNIHGRLVFVDIDVDSNYDGEIDDDDEPLEMDPGGLVCVCSNNLTKIELKVLPKGLPGKVTLSYIEGGERIRLWKNPDRTGELDMVGDKHEWLNLATMPPELWVEGVTNSVSPCDVKLKLEYDDDKNGSDSDLFKASDMIALTVIMAYFDNQRINVRNWTNTVDDIYFPVNYNKFTPVIWQRSRNLDLAAYLITETQKFSEYLRWSVNSIDSFSSVMGYGGRLRDLNIEIHRVEVGLKGSVHACDRLVVVIVSPETERRYRVWVDRFETETQWLTELPVAYLSLAQNNGNPEPNNCEHLFWQDWGVRRLNSYFHGNATFDMRSAQTPGGHGHQACYTTDGEFITSGFSAGTADFRHYSHYFTRAHATLDVLPFIRAAQLDGNPVTANSKLAPTNMTHPLVYEGVNINTYLRLRPTLPSAEPLLNPNTCTP